MKVAELIAGGSLECSKVRLIFCRTDGSRIVSVQVSVFLDLISLYGIIHQIEFIGLSQVCAFSNDDQSNSVVIKSTSFGWCTFYHEA